LQRSIRLFRLYRMKQLQRFLQKGKRRSGRHFNPESRQQIFQNAGHNAVRKDFENLEGTREMGQESE
jgi:hypothetical protein